MIKTKRDATVLRWTHPEIFKQIWTPDDMTDLMLKEMAENGIDKALIQPNIGQVMNPKVAAAVKRHPDKFVGLFHIGAHYLRGKDPRSAGIRPVLNIGNVDDFVKHCVKDLGMKGCGETPPHQFSKESAPEKLARDFSPLLEACAKYKIPIQFATAWSQFGTWVSQFTPFFVDHLAERFPDVPIIITKMGRGYSFMFEMALEVAYKHINVYLDTVNSIPEHLKRAVQELGAEYVLYGSDYCPTWRNLTDFYPNSLALIDQAGLSDDEREWVLWKTCAKVFKLKV